MAESFNAALEHETRAGTHGWTDVAHARRAVFAGITSQSPRRHCSCDRLSPATYENAHDAATLATAA